MHRAVVSAVGLLFVALVLGPPAGLAAVPASLFSDGIRSELPRFSNPPTDDELRWKRIFPEPLVPFRNAEGSKSRAVENRALGRAIVSWVESSEVDHFAPIEEFLAQYPSSRWRPSLLLNLGFLQYRTGYFSAALESWREGWQLGKGATEAAEKEVADQTIAQLTLLSARLGRTDELAGLLKEIESRPMYRPSELVRQARDGLAMMYSDPGSAFRCGPLSLGRVLAAMRPGVQVDARIEALRSTPRGLSLSHIAELANELSMDLRPGKRKGDAPIALPAIIHWKSGHFAALVEARRDVNGTQRFHVDDPTFSDDLWVTEKALREEGSGYFLVSSAVPEHEWLPVSEPEARSVWGRGWIGDNDPGGTGPNDGRVGGSSGGGGGGFGGTGGGPRRGGAGGGPGGGGAGGGGNGGDGPDPCMSGSGGGGGGGACESCGLATYSFHAMLVSLQIIDTPVGYRPPLGPPIDFTVTYTQRDAAQTGTPNYSNFGPKWTHQYFAFVTEPAMAGANLTLATRGGGYEEYTGYNSTTHRYAPQWLSRTILTRLDQPVMEGYERLYPDGSKELYKVTDGLPTSPKWFLSGIIDSAGNSVTLTYDSIPQGKRLTTITDAIGQFTTLSYEHADPLRITKVMDPFGRFAMFSYNVDSQLWKITDVITLESEFGYAIGGDRVNSLTTPYGTTTFQYQAPPTPTPPMPTVPCPDTPTMSTWIEATDPLGKTERLEYRHGVNAGLCCEAPCCPSPLSCECCDPMGAPVMPVSNTYMRYRNSFYWDKKAWAEHPSDYTKAVVYHWLHTLPPEKTARVLESFKRPLESRIWFLYDGQAHPNKVGSASMPNQVGRLLDDGSTQVTHYEYNSVGNMTKRIDPLDRETTYTYTANGIDLLEVRQKVATGTELLAAFTYNSQHQPLTYKDAANRDTTFVYKPNGQIESITNPKTEVTTFVYDSNNWYLQSIQRPLAATTSFQYDGAGRVWKVTTPAPDNDIFTFEYDNLDRLKKTIFPDTTYTETTYDKLDVQKVRDRRGKETTYIHDPLRRVTSVTDPLARTVSFGYCDCGGLSSMTDDLGHITTWDRDIQGRVTKKTFDDLTDIDFTYEDRTSRLKTAVDAKGQTTTFTWALDSALLQKSYSGGPVTTPNVRFTYDPYYPRVEQMSDGTGLTNYDYRSVGSDGALQLSLVDGPLLSDELTFTYDELGRVRSRLIDGFGVSNIEYDALSRLTLESDVLGDFSYGYVGSTDRVSTIAYPNGQSTTFAYHPATQSRRLSLLTNLGPPPTSPLLSEFSYPLYNPDGDILQWSQAPGVPPDAITYDDARQLKIFGLKPKGTGDFEFNYDDSGNLQTELRPTYTRTYTHNTTNAITQWVDPAQTMLLTHDLNGNLVTEGTVRSYQWDAENRLTKVTEGPRTSEFTYDGLSRRVGIVEKLGTTVLSDRRYIWCGIRPCEERDVTTLNIRRFLSHGFQDGTTKYFYTRDHLGSVREVTNIAGSAITRYTYDPWGKQTKVFGTVEAPVGYAGYWTHANGGLNLTWYRGYSPELRRWLSRDPIGEVGGINLYAYGANSPLLYVDPLGLSPRSCFVKGLGAGAVGSALVLVGAGVATVFLAPAIVTTGLVVLALAGTASLAADLRSHYRTGNTDGIADDVGALLGGLAVGGAGGRSLGRLISPGVPSPSWSPRTDVSQMFNPALGTVGSYMGTGPNQASGVVAVALGGAGAATATCGCE